MLGYLKDPPPKRDCLICMLPVPWAQGLCGVVTSYQPCCGKTLCEGCMRASKGEIIKGKMKDLCLFCRVPHPRSCNDVWKRIHKRMKLKDAEAFNYKGLAHHHGTYGVPIDLNKEVELLEKAAELGSVTAYNTLASIYWEGRGLDDGQTVRVLIERDAEKAVRYYKIAAMGGHEGARSWLGIIEEFFNSNMDRAMKHYVISARSGFSLALEKVGEGYKAGHVTKDEYASTLRAYKDSCDEMKRASRGP